MNDEGTQINGDVNTGGGDFVGRDKNVTIINQPAAPRTSSLLPPLPSLIVGRDQALVELKMRLSALPESGASVQVITAMRGWPGVGKTTLAAWLAHDPEIQQTFPDGVLWVSLGTTPNLLSELSAWGRALKSESLQNARDLKQARELLAGLLQDKRMLLILDDVWEAEHAAPFLSGGRGCATLITTRLNDLARELVLPDQIYVLPVLTVEAALELLGKLAPQVVEQHPTEARELMEALEGLPLAIQVAGRLLQSELASGFGVRELMSELQKGAALLKANVPLDRRDLVNETTPTVAALLFTSLEKLDGQIREYYAYLGVFAPQPATFDLDAMAFVWEVEDVRPIVRTLVDRGLLEYISELQRYQMHALLVMLAKTLLTD
jgi:hypothetical protein